VREILTIHALSIEERRTGFFERNVMLFFIARSFA
jgi:hypothetical protein